MLFYSAASHSCQQPPRRERGTVESLARPQALPLHLRDDLIAFRFHPTVLDSRRRV